MRDKKPAIIAVLSVILLVLIVYIIQDVRSNLNQALDEDSVEEELPPVDQSDEENGELTEKPEVETPEFPIWYEEGPFELPITGAGGYTSIELNMYTEPNAQTPIVEKLEAGTPFEIQEEKEEWWLVKTKSGNLGWLKHQFALINLPDVVPSIIYDHTNSYNAQFKSSYVDIPELTGQALYEMIDYNNRLDEETYIMPILYQTAKKVYDAQQIALQNGESLIVYETFRPRDVQLLVNEALADLAESNDVVKAGITKEPWSMTWFINTNVSNHQRGVAIDLSLVRVDELSERIVGDYHVPKVLDYTPYEMQTPLHELSINSAMFTKPIASKDQEGWKKMEVSSAVTEPALRLQEYMTEAGFTPLASEWWHFNDVDALNSIGEKAGTGKFRITQSLNRPPKWEEGRTTTTE